MKMEIALLLEMDAVAGLTSVGVAISVREVVAEEGRAVLSYEGPTNLRRAVEMNVRNALRGAEPRVKLVEFEN